MRVRFSIRDLLWLTALAAIAVTWWLDHRAQEIRYQSLLPNTPKFEAYPITTADPNFVLNVLQAAMAGSPNVQLSVDIKSNSVVAQALPKQHAIIRALMDQLDRKERQKWPSPDQFEQMPILRPGARR
jgi:hypothetical protein